jgi:CubicO group peptidase (beta-lactamase class C family)
MMKITLLLTLSFMIGNTCFAQTKTEKIDELLRTYHALGQFNGNALVLEKGKVILQSGYGYQNVDDKTLHYPKTIFQIGSITKQFTATIILKLAQQGKLKLADKLSKYYPDFIKADSISIHHLLNHTSGIYNYTNDAAFMQNEVTSPVTEKRMLDIFLKKELDFSPGSQFNYSNSGYYLLGAIIRKVTHKSYEQTVREMIFQPTGMTHSGFDFVHLKSIDKATGYASLQDEEIRKDRIVDSSVSFSGGAIYSTTGDLLKWHYALLNNKVISRASLDKAFTVYKDGFGYGWVIDSVAGRKAVYHNGSIPGFTSNIYRVEKDDVCIILLNNTGNPQIDEITKGIVSILYGKPYKLPVLRVVVNLPVEEVQKYSGVFEFSPEFKLKIYTNDGKLFAQRVGEDQSFRIYYYKEDHFFLKKMDAQLEFRPLEKVVILHQGGREMRGKRID